MDCPDFLYGTAWKEEETKPLVKLALKTGFRGIDTANQRKHYHEAAVGEAVREACDEGIVDRDELFLQTKYTYPAGQDHRLPYEESASADDQVRQSLESSLEHLGTDYIDSYVLHGPSARQGLADADRTVWRTLEELAGSEKVDRIGVSNVSSEQLTALVEFADAKPAFVQNRCFARTTWDKATRDVCEANAIRYQGFSLLTANQRELQAEAIRDIAEHHEKTIPQVIFRFALDLGMVALTGTTSEEHMKQDLACTEFELSPDEVEAIESISGSR